MIRSLVPSLVLSLGACASLPAGWEDATSIADFTQAECSGSPYEEYDERAEATVADGAVTVEVSQSHFRCEQDVEGFYRMDGDTLQVLVQPVDMNPRIVAGCDCLYDLNMTVDVDASEVEVFRRWDDLNDDNDPVAIPTTVL